MLATQWIFYVYPDPWGNDPIWWAFLFTWVVQPPTRFEFCYTLIIIVQAIFQFSLPGGICPKAPNQSIPGKPRSWFHSGFNVFPQDPWKHDRIVSRKKKSIIVDFYWFILSIKDRKYLLLFFETNPMLLKFPPMFFKKNNQVVVSNIFYFHPYLGKMNPFWRSHIFQMGWFNHQPDKYRGLLFHPVLINPIRHCFKLGLFCWN